MGKKWKDAAHLIRPTLVFLAAVLAFVVIRGAVVPDTFGRYGHYRAAVLDEIRTLPVRHAGREVCAGCHPDESELLGKGKHRGVACEACHGPAAAHAGDPGTGKPSIAGVAALCSQCHEKHTAKPAWFKQVVSKEHYGGQSCEGCHRPHSPSF